VVAAALVAALVAVVPREPAVPVAARLALPVQRSALADPHPLRAPVAPLLVQVLVVVHRVVEPAVAVELLLSRL
jgi:hypothetical protein